MTQPVQEPLTQRSISSLQWGQNQLYRRPDVNAGSDNPSIWAVAAWFDGADVEDEIFEPATWDDFYLSEEAADTGLLFETGAFSIGLDGTILPANADGGYWMQQVAASWLGTAVTGWVLVTANCALSNTVYSQADINDWQPTEMLFEHSFDQTHAAEAHRPKIPSSNMGTFNAEVGAWTGAPEFLAGLTLMVVKAQPYTGTGTFVTP